MSSNTSLNAISPLEGRYHAKLDHLRPIFSEYGLIKFRVIVEIQWLRTLCEYAQIPELPPLSKRSNEVLLSMV